MQALFNVPVTLAVIHMTPNLWPKQNKNIWFCPHILWVRNSEGESLSLYNNVWTLSWEDLNNQSLLKAHCSRLVVDTGCWLGHLYVSSPRGCLDFSAKCLGFKNEIPREPGRTLYHHVWSSLTSTVVINLPKFKEREHRPAPPTREMARSCCRKTGNTVVVIFGKYSHHSTSSDHNTSFTSSHLQTIPIPFPPRPPSPSSSWHQLKSFHSGPCVREFPRCSNLGSTSPI